MSQAINSPLINVAGTTINLASVVAIDWRDYDAERKVADRQIIVNLVGPVEFIYQGTEADEFYTWWQQTTGQNRVQPAPSGLKLT